MTSKMHHAPTYLQFEFFHSSEYFPFKQTKLVIPGLLLVSVAKREVKHFFLSLSMSPSSFVFAEYFFRCIT